LVMRIEIDGWKQNITFSGAHFLPGFEKCERLHGHVYAIHLIMSGEVNDDDILFDFRIDFRNYAREVFVHHGDGS